MLFAISKIGWAFTVPGNFLLLALIVGAALLWSGRVRAGRWVVSIAIVGLAIGATRPIADHLLSPLESRFPPVATPPAHVDGIIVLAGGIDIELTLLHRQPAFNEAAERYTAFAALARRYPTARLVYSGGSSLVGQGHRPPIDMLQACLRTLGMDTGRIVFETESRNTYESAVALRSLLKSSAGQTWLLVTSAYHMPRSIGVFRKAGWQPMAYPVDYRADPALPWYHQFDLKDGLKDLEIAAHEWLGLAAYFFLDRTSALFPSPAPAAP